MSRTRCTLLLLCAVLTLLAVVGCAESPTETPPSASALTLAADRSDGGLLAQSAGEEGPKDLLVLFDESVDDPLTFLAELGLEGLIEAISGRLAALQSVDTDLLLALENAGVVTTQANHGLVLSAPSDLTMAFFEGELDDGVLRRRAEFSSLQLGTVHQRVDGSGVRVAVLDTGVDPEHPHLAQRLELFESASLGAPVEIADGVDDDGDGMVDEAFGHGTHVAGIVATVAPGATLVPIRILDADGVGTAYELALGLREAIEHGVDVINLSISIDERSSVVESLLRRAHDAGIAVVAAAGNTGSTATYPAAYPSVLGTAATDVDLTRIADFSARGLDVAMAAPGTSILSSYPGGGWAEASGSSMAAAVLTGAWAVLESQAPGTGSALRLLEVALPVDPVESVAHGRVDVVRALGDRVDGARGLDVRQPH